MRTSNNKMKNKNTTVIAALSAPSPITCRQIIQTGLDTSCSQENYDAEKCKQVNGAIHAYDIVS
jgi:hypothetical protein